jgi:hydrogenase nickel incorporation protein HypA/HybF
MHELVITQSLVNIALEKAKEVGAVKIKKISLMIGKLSGYVPEAVEMNFRLITPGTKADMAKLEIKWIPIICRCSNCGNEYQNDQVDLNCIKCGTLSGKIIGGREMFIESMEVEMLEDNERNKNPKKYPGR